jgi:integrase
VRPIKHGKYRFGVTVPPELNGGKRRRQFFAKLKDAQFFATDLAVQKENYGTRVSRMPEQLREEAIRCAEQLQPFQATLAQAVAYYVQHQRNARTSCTVEELVAKFIPAKQTSGRSERYLGDLRVICGDFARRYGTRIVSEITPEDVETWIDNKSHSPTTRNNRLRTLSSAFAWAVNRRLCESNPVSRVERATERKPVARYLSAAQAKPLLEAADKDLLPCIAIQLFAGLRPCEMAELKFENINFERNLIAVDSEEHTTSHRFIEVMPNLRDWLLPYRARTGLVMPSDFQKRWNRLRQQVGLYDRWPHDGLRHSFGTWHFAKFQDLGKTAAQMGHSNPAITRKHYVVREDPGLAEEYWSLGPTEQFDG